jgi:hypothetical protein
MSESLVQYLRVPLCFCDANEPTVMVDVRFLATCEAGRIKIVSLVTFERHVGIHHVKCLVSASHLIRKATM